MELPEWSPIYMTDDERADIAARLIMRGQDTTDRAERTRCLYLAGLLVFVTSPEVHA